MTGEAAGETGRGCVAVTVITEVIGSPAVTVMAGVCVTVIVSCGLGTEPLQSMGFFGPERHSNLNVLSSLFA